MDIIATQKFLIMSPKKLRLIADVARKMKPNEAVERLPYLNKRGAKIVAKVVATAIANAKNKGVSESDLIFKTLEINEGPRLKRGNPVSRGQWHPIKKRMSHIRVVLTTQVSNIQTPNSKLNPNETISNKQEEIKTVKKLKKGEK